LPLRRGLGRRVPERLELGPEVAAVATLLESGLYARWLLAA
jgi:hypothetical protein